MGLIFSSVSYLIKDMSDHINNVGNRIKDMSHRIAIVGDAYGGLRLRIANVRHHTTNVSAL